MKKVITYGTFDHFHHGHLNILKKSKAMGDYLIVGVTAEQFQIEKGKLNVEQSLSERIRNIRKLGLADEIIIEYHEGQKISDIKKMNIDVFVKGSDWIGKYDYLNQYCDVIYVERTKNISSSKIRNKKLKNVSFGILGINSKARAFILESKYVSGCNVHGVCSKKLSVAKEFSEEYDLGFYTNNYKELIEACNVIYISGTFRHRFKLAKYALSKGKHVLSETPIALESEQLEELYNIADVNQVVLLEGIVTAYCPGFNRLIEIATSNIIGEICSVEATTTKFLKLNGCKFNGSQSNMCINELATFPLLLTEKLLGPPKEVKYQSITKNKNAIFSKLNLEFKQAFATLNIGMGIESREDLRITGTHGYIYVPSPWWKTQEFELHFNDSSRNKKCFYKFNGDGLRYEINEMLQLIKNGQLESWHLSRMNILNISKVIGRNTKSVYNKKIPLEIL